MTFSKRIVLVYTFIVTIPLIVLLIFIFSGVKRRNYAQLKNDCLLAAEANALQIRRNLAVFDSIEQMIGGNYELMHFLRVPEGLSEEERIQTLIAETDEIERTLSVLPDIYGLRVFANNPLIQERWPIIMSSDRTDLYSLKKWECNYEANYIGNMTHLSELSVCSTRSLKYYNLSVGYLQVTMKMEDFFPFLYEGKAAFLNDYIYSLRRSGDEGGYELIPIVNEKVIQRNKTLSSAEIAAIQKELSENFVAQRGLFVLKNGFKKSYAAWHLVPDMELAIVHTASFDAIRSQIYLLESFVLFAILATVIILFFIIRLTSAKLLSGVYALIAGMKKVQGGDYNTRLEENAKDELGEALHSFNRMAAQLGTQIELIKQEEHLIAETEMKAMQNQINAHFLYNILETIKMQAVIANEDDIAESLTVLGKLMHYSLRWKIHIVHLSQEIEYIRSYIYLLNLRNDYVISLQTEIPEEYGSILIPKMILQPLVENSFSHGIEPLGKDAAIRVFSQLDPQNKERLFLCVQDFGGGIPKEKLAEIQDYLSLDAYEKDNTGSIGLKNIQQRLVILYGKNFRIQIESKEGQGTCIKIPIKREIERDDSCFDC